MILNRLGNKQQLAPKLIPLFPKHEIYIEPFFGTGSIFFTKPRAKYNFLNDIDHDVYNLFRQLLDHKEELIYQINITPITERQFKEWGKGKREETDLINAVRFLFISNFGLYGKTSTLRLCAVSPKDVILSEIERTFNALRTAYFFNCDFRKVFGKVDYKSNKEKTFCYCDPPYLETDDNYSHSFTEQDSFDLFETLQAAEIRWAMSEFDHPFILKQAEERNLNIHYLGERKNLMNRRVEVVITNYTVPQQSLFN
jgi:DNA adenine methylase